MSRDDCRWQQLQHRQRPETALESDRSSTNNPLIQGSQRGSDRLQTTETTAITTKATPMTSKASRRMKPLQKHLKVHLTTRQERPVAKGPIRTGQTSLHDTGGPSDHHKRDHSDNEVCRETSKTACRIESWKRTSSTVRLEGLRKPDRT